MPDEEEGQQGEERDIELPTEPGGRGADIEMPDGMAVDPWASATPEAWVNPDPWGGAAPAEDVANPVLDSAKPRQGDDEDDIEYGYVRPEPATEYHEVRDVGDPVLEPTTEETSQLTPEQQDIINDMLKGNINLMDDPDLNPGFTEPFVDPSPETTEYVPGYVDDVVDEDPGVEEVLRIVQQAGDDVVDAPAGAAEGTVGPPLGRSYIGSTKEFSELAEDYNGLAAAWDREHTLQTVADIAEDAAEGLVESVETIPFVGDAVDYVEDRLDHMDDPVVDPWG
jgi:hypothetical protein